MQSLLILKLHLLLALLLLGCKMSAWRTPNPSTLVGEPLRATTLDSDKMPMGKEIFWAVYASSPLVMVRISDGEKKGALFCSGVLVEGEGDLPRVLTKHQCVIDTQQRPDCANTVVYFEIIGEKPDKGGVVPKLVRKCKQGSLRTSPEAGLAVFTLSEILPSDYSVIEVWDEDKTTAKRQVFSMYYPPQPQYLQRIGMVKIEGGLDGKAPPKFVNMGGCSIDRRIPPSVYQHHAVQKLPNAPELRYSIAHNCRLAGGGAGAGLFDMETGKLLALHAGFMQVGEAVVFFATHAIHLRQFLAGEKITLP